MESVLHIAGELGLEPLHVLIIAIVVAAAFVNWLLFSGVDAGARRSGRFDMSCDLRDDDGDGDGD